MTRHDQQKRHRPQRDEDQLPRAQQDQRLLARYDIIFRYLTVYAGFDPSTQAIGRSLMSQLSPPDKESEFFGFYLLAGKVGSIFALLLFGGISSVTGNQRLAVLWLLPLFALGLFAVYSIDEPKGLARYRRVPRSARTEPR